MFDDKSRLETVSKDLRRFFAKRVKSLEDAEDLTQLVFVKILNSKSELRDDSKLIPWIYKIARNALTDYYRKHKNVHTEFKEIAQENEESDNLNEDFIQCIQPMLDLIPERYASAIREIELNDLKQSDYAKKYDLSISGSKSRIQRARLMLLDQINDCCRPVSDSFGNIVDQNKKSDC